MLHRPRRKPKIKTYPPIVRVHNEAKARLAQKRFACWKQREREAKRQRGDQLRFYSVPLLDSEVAALLSDLSTDHRARHQEISDSEWERVVVGRAIAAAVRWAINRK